MKKIVYILLALFCTFSFKEKIFAVCDNAELNDFAERVELILLPESFVSNDEEGVEYAYILYLSEEQEGLYLKVKDNLYSEEFIVNYDPELKNYIIGSFIHYVSKRYVVEIYVKDDNKVCPGEKLKTMVYTVPPFNEYSDSEFCESNPEADMCRKFTDNSNITRDEFNNLVNDKPVTFKSVMETILDYVKAYWLYVLIPVVLIGVFYTIRIYLFKKKEDKE